jgi:hypothetical protein
MSPLQPLRHRAALALAVIGSVTGGAALAGPASADPVNQNTQPLTIACSDASTYLASDLDNFTGAEDLPRRVVHLVDGNAVFIPTHYGDVHVEVTSLEDGSLVFAEDRTFDVSKGNAGNVVGGILECTASFSNVEEIPGFGEVLVSGSFEIDGYLSRSGS